MATNLDRSLDEILSDKKKDRRNNQRKAGPVGGVRKRSARIEQKKKTAPAPAAPAQKKSDKKKTDTKIQVSNLPTDINESMLREYFTSIVGPMKRCQIVYKANGQSAGAAQIEFNRPGDANVAFEQFNGRLVDNRPMKVEIVVDPSKVPLADRISGPKPGAKATPKAVNSANKPKPATNGRANGVAAGGARGARRGGRGGRKGASGSGGAKRTKKTVEELDQEMADYYKGGEAAAPAAAPTAADTAAMEDL